MQYNVNIMYNRDVWLEDNMAAFVWRR